MSDLDAKRAQVLRALRDAQRESADKVKTIRTQLEAIHAEAHDRLAEALLDAAKTLTSPAAAVAASPCQKLYIVSSIDHDQHTATVHLVTPDAEYAKDVLKKMKDIECLRRATGGFYDHCFDVDHTFLYELPMNEFCVKGHFYMQA